MKKEDIYLLAAAAAALFVIMKVIKPKGAAASASGISPAGQQYTSIVAGDNGWKYYSDGTSIALNGDYYYQGKKVWQPPGGSVYNEPGMYSGEFDP